MFSDPLEVEVEVIVLCHQFLYRSPRAELKPQDYDERRSGPYRPQIGMAPSSQRGSLHGAGHRMLG